MGPMGGMGNKSPNLQAGGNPAVQSSLANSLGAGGGPMGNSMVMSIASNGNQQQQPMSSMQGKGN